MSRYDMDDMRDPAVASAMRAEQTYTKTDGAVTGEGCSPGTIEVLREISQLTTALRQGGPDPMDLQGLSEALEHATNIAHDALTSLRPATPTGSETHSSDGGGESRPALSSTLAPLASAVADVVVHPAGVAPGPSEAVCCSAGIEVEPAAWLAEYDGHVAVTTNRDTMLQWKDTLGRKITPLYASAAQAEPNRHTVIERAIRDYCRRQSSAAVQEGRIYYAGLSITDLVNDIEAALTLSPDVAAEARNAVIEECAKVAEAEKQTFISPEYASNQPFGSLCERFACDEVAKAIRALSTNCSCGGDAAQPADHHDISCPLAISSANQDAP